MDDSEELVAAARAAAARRGVRRLTIDAFQRETGIGKAAVYRHFESWRALCAAAGLAVEETNRRVPEEEVFAAMRDAFVREGRILTLGAFVHRAPIGRAVLRRRFGTWQDALAAFRRWAIANAPDFPLLGALHARLGHSPGARPYEPASPALPAWPTVERRPSGAVLAFRAMAFAPINEAGVVALFGMAAAELGYSIETVTAGFPDCTARRHIGGGRWEGVRIEFEYRSRAFREHGHDPAGCDVIVCWEHDWPDCPLEVLALREAIAALPAR
jgi:AcrR family transcriptional regulator